MLTSLGLCRTIKSSCKFLFFFSGLNTFADNPDEASNYLKPLLQYAASYIPKEHHKETLLYILATAGMRMLPEE